MSAASAWLVRPVLWPRGHAQPERVPHSGEGVGSLRPRERRSPSVFSSRPVHPIRRAESPQHRTAPASPDAEAVLSFRGGRPPPSISARWFGQRFTPPVDLRSQNWGRHPHFGYVARPARDVPPAPGRAATRREDGDAVTDFVTFLRSPGARPPCRPRLTAAPSCASPGALGGAARCWFARGSPLRRRHFLHRRTRPASAGAAPALR